MNNVKGRDYICNCGFHKHRDLVGAMNILHAPKA
ncbi:zinc ribbon domain-containing protein [Amedibacillus hominis]